jgi:16S rRNA (guanine527-N7)-methyltransferase
LPQGLADVCRALHLSPSPEQSAALLSYAALLQRWNGTYNLTALREPQAVLTQHLADCLAVVPPVSRWHAQREGGERAASEGVLTTGRPGRSTVRVLDVGSGGGLPGVVLAVMCPSLTVECVDAVGKKAAFVRQVAAELGLRNLHARHARVEQVKAAPFDLITARAFASLADFVRLTGSLLARDGAWMAMKGKEPQAEIAGLPAGIDVFHVEPLSVPGLEADRCLVWMRPSGRASTDVSTNSGTAA